MTKTLEEWIAAFFKAKKWDPIQVPNYNRDVMHSPVRELGLRKAVADEREKALATDLAKAGLVVQDLTGKLAVARKSRSGNPAEIERQLDAARRREELLQAEHDLAADRVRLQKTLLDRAAKDHDRETLKERLGNEFDALRNVSERLAKATGTPDDSEDAQRQRSSYEKLLATVETELRDGRKQRITVKASPMDEGRSYNAINRFDYTLVSTMLRTAQGHAGLGEYDKAMLVLNTASRTLKETVAHREGELRFIPEEPELSGKASGLRDTALGLVKAFRSAGMTDHADMLKDRISVLAASHASATGPDAETQRGSSEAGLELIVTTATPLLPLLEKFRAADRELKDVRGSLEDLNAPGEVIALDTDRGSRKAKLGKDVARDLAWLEGLVTEYRELAIIRRNSDAEVWNADPEALLGRRDKLAKGFDSLFKHDGDGSVKTIRDSATRREKGVKKNSKLPRAALVELEMQLVIADMILDSPSPEVMKQAKSHLDTVENFETQIDEESGAYSETKEHIGDLQKIVARLAGKYGAYQGEEQLSLKLAVEALEDSYTGKPPRDAAREAFVMLKDARELKRRVQELDARHKALAKDVRAQEKLLDGLGKLLKSSGCKVEGVKILVYEGDLRSQLTAISAGLEERDKGSLDTAATDLVQLQTDIEDAIALAKTRLGKKGTAQDDQADPEWDAFLDSAKSGQESRNANLEAGKTFRSRLEPMQDEVKQLIAGFKKQALDRTGPELLKTELGALAKRMKAEEKYSDGLLELDRIETRIAAQTETLAALARFKSLPIDAAGAETAKTIRAFRTFVDGFDDLLDTLPDAAEGETGADPDPAVLRTFLDLVLAAVPEKLVADLEDQTATYAKAVSLSPETRRQRETALATLRNLAGRLEGSEAVRQFRQQTLFPSGAYDGAVQSLTRLEVKLLTSLKS